MTFLFTSLLIVQTFKYSSGENIQEVITEDKMSWYLDRFSLLVQ